MTAFRPSLIAVAFLSVVATAEVSAQTSLFADLTNDAETSPVIPTLGNGAARPVSYGFATFTILADQSAMVWTATIHNIDVTGSQTADTNDDLVAAHIHAGPGVTPSTNGGVVWGFFGAPFNDNNPMNVTLTPFASGVGGVFTGAWDLNEGQNTTLTAQLPFILSDRAYMNFHTVQFRGGEIRGTLQVVPEPGTVILLGSGLLALGVIGRRTRRGRTAA